ncbi:MULTISPECIES: glycogen synthase GlgA [unclassified Vibrio]|uniref:Glycogen synthase n=1 Tax=Vibrio sp. HB236076 TaxID=3232307 RepID=A0AB39HHC7_9VIBR|nr:glycogen synthase GlgA [Vibrio sp. HB161653]MDP5255062.1 glycogen synthase GlgA [Vibrio sp. HB161653]
MDSNSLSICYMASEVEGLVKSGGLADVARALPQALQDLNHNIKVVIPAYQVIEGIEHADVVLATELEQTGQAYRILQLRCGDLTVYAIDCPEYFRRSALYAENNCAYHDNGERFAFFSMAALDMLSKLDEKIDIIHVNDWHTGLVPFIFKHRYAQHPAFLNTKVVFTIHNAVFKGSFHPDELSILGELSQHPDLLVTGQHASMLKAGVLCADKINAVSPTYAKELLTDLGSHGFGGVFGAREADLSGILNGCDYQAWSPQQDPWLVANYSEKKQSLQTGKARNKRALQQRLSLPEQKVAMFGMVCRLTHQKGIQYLIPILEKFLQHQVQVVIVGTGEVQLAQQLHDIERLYPHNFRFVEAYDNELAHWVEAGSDFFLMPSEFEPCGLNQIYSLAYGTLPIVRAVGGLKDTVVDYFDAPNSATGFVFHEPTGEALLLTLLSALLVYEQLPKVFVEMQIRAMNTRFDWETSALSYLAMYESCLK